MHYVSDAMELIITYITIHINYTIYSSQDCTVCLLCLQFDTVTNISERMYQQKHR